ncbi:hypothetical protein MLD38_014670 [Melastoma candidum]|uniref:Uncharacterized protein n=1 Tax=Melastoma candidum TaxID=119954 RepID=A0ACB9RE41_9MYRT|nr:hypothetical protein MLD38_014670 [Melastoma candidum]
MEQVKVIMLFLVFWVGVVVYGIDSEATGSGDIDLNVEIEHKLKLLNKPAVKSIWSEDGDVFDCIDVHNQPAFDLPTLKNHKIQMKPSFKLPQESSNVKGGMPSLLASQTWRKNGSCPIGTVPIRRVRKQDLLRATSVGEFGKKYLPSNSPPREQVVVINNTQVKVPVMDNYSQAIILTMAYNYIGAEGDINVWNPRVDLDSDFTTAQIWLSHGYEFVEAGWMVNPKLYGDRQTRLFVHWTVDANQGKGCFDLTCPGFVQTSHDVGVGSAITPISSTSGDQYEITVSINWDPQTTNWWVAVNNYAFGYFPGELFNLLRHSATIVRWGGEVYSPQVKGNTPHTGTAMGSGQYSDTLAGNACYINKIRETGWNMQKKYPEWVAVWSDEEYCYNGNNFREGIVGEPTFYFGGPGQGRYCP